MNIKNFLESIKSLICFAPSLIFICYFKRAASVAYVDVTLRVCKQAYIL